MSQTLLGPRDWHTISKHWEEFKGHSEYGVGKISLVDIINAFFLGCRSDVLSHLSVIFREGWFARVYVEDGKVLRTTMITTLRMRS